MASRRPATFLLFSIALGGISASARGQMLLYEGFNHMEGNNLVGSGSWTEDASGSALTIAGGSLVSPVGLPSTGNRVQIPTSTGHQSAQLQFDATGSNSVFASFLFRLDVVNSLSTSFATLTRVESGGVNGLGVFVRQNSGSADQFDLGIHKRANSGSAVTDASLQGLSENTVYFVLVQYAPGQGTGDDEMRIWLNPTTNLGQPSLRPTVMEDPCFAGPSRFSC